MGTNYYARTQDEEWVEKYFGRFLTLYSSFEHTCTYAKTSARTPDGRPLYEKLFEIHLSKKSGGWEPLLQWHPDAYKSFSEMKAFFRKHAERFEIFDEYGDQVALEDYLAGIERGQHEDWNGEPPLRHTKDLTRSSGGSPFIHDRDGYSFKDCPFS